MKKILIGLNLLLFATSGYAQKFHEVDLVDDADLLPYGLFYVENVVDDREFQSPIGVVQKGLFNAQRPARFPDGFTHHLLSYYQRTVLKESGEVPITVKIDHIKIWEKTTMANEFAYAEVSLQYFYKSKLLYKDQRDIKSSGLDVTSLHDDNIRQLLNESLKAFSESEWLQKVENASEELNPIKVLQAKSGEKGEEKEQKKESELRKFKNPPSRNVFAIGYQIGGYTLVGVDYEIRISDVAGVHFGAGFSGYTIGLKLHTNPHKDSPFFNVSLKDGGFGLIKAAGVEFGDRWVFSEEGDLGFHFQIGIVKILSIDKDFEQRLFSDDNSPEFMLSAGIGLSW